MNLGDPKTVNREIYLGTPLSVQVVAPRLQERRLVRAMEAVDMALRATEKGRGRGTKL